MVEWITLVLTALALIVAVIAEREKLSSFGQELAQAVKRSESLIVLACQAPFSLTFLVVLGLFTVNVIITATIFLVQPEKHVAPGHRCGHRRAHAARDHQLCHRKIVLPREKGPGIREFHALGRARYRAWPGNILGLRRRDQIALRALRDDVDSRHGHGDQRDAHRHSGHERGAHAAG